MNGNITKCMTCRNEWDCPIKSAYVVKCDDYEQGIPDASLFSKLSVEKPEGQRIKELEAENDIASNIIASLQKDSTNLEAELENCRRILRQETEAKCQALSLWDSAEVENVLQLKEIDSLTAKVGSYAEDNLKLRVENVELRKRLKKLISDIQSNCGDIESVFYLCAEQAKIEVKP